MQIPIGELFWSCLNAAMVRAMSSPVSAMSHQDQSSSSVAPTVLIDTHAMSILIVAIFSRLLDIFIKYCVWLKPGYVIYCYAYWFYC